MILRVSSRNRPKKWIRLWAWFLVLNLDFGTHLFDAPIYLQILDMTNEHPESNKEYVVPNTSNYFLPHNFTEWGIEKENWHESLGEEKIGTSHKDLASIYEYVKVNPSLKTLVHLKKI